METPSTQTTPTRSNFYMGEGYTHVRTKQKPHGRTESQNGPRPTRAMELRNKFILQQRSTGASLIPFSKINKSPVKTNRNNHNTGSVMSVVTQTYNSPARSTPVIRNTPVFSSIKGYQSLQKKRLMKSGNVSIQKDYHDISEHDSPIRHGVQRMLGDTKTPSVLLQKDGNLDKSSVKTSKSDSGILDMTGRLPSTRSISTQTVDRAGSLQIFIEFLIFVILIAFYISMAYS